MSTENIPLEFKIIVTADVTCPWFVLFYMFLIFFSRHYLLLT